MVCEFSSRMSYGVVALNKYFISFSTFVVVSISPKFSFLAIFPIVVAWSAVNASVFEGRRSGFSWANCSAKSGIYTSPMLPTVPSQISWGRLKVFCAMYEVGSAEG